MKFKAKFLQEGGTAPAAPAEGGAPAGGANPEEQIAQMAQQIVQQLGPEAAAMLAQVIMQMLQGGAAQGAAPEAAPAYAKKGGKLVRVTKQ